MEDEHHFRKPANDITSQLEINFGDLGRTGRGRGGPRGGRGGRGRGGPPPGERGGDTPRPPRGGRAEKVKIRRDERNLKFKSTLRCSRVNGISRVVFLENSRKEDPENN